VLLIAVVLILAGLAIWLYNTGRLRPPTAPTTTQSAIATPGSLAQVAKPRPIATTFEGCPPSGDGGDPVLNTLKNRIDEAPWYPTTVSAILALGWPEEVEFRSRARWSEQDAARVAQYEGAPVQVEGYLVSAKKMSPESCNCHSVEHVDWHVWLVDDPSKGREQSIVTEVTPRVKVHHPGWTLSRLQEIANHKQKVRISGWLMLDPEHPDQVGKTRGTIWEIHPIMQIEVLEGGRWVPLDGGSTGVSSSLQAHQSLPPVTPANTATSPPPADEKVQDNRTVQITNIFYDGAKRNEPDEYVEITNTGTEPVDITDWELQDVTGGVEFKWESYVMQPGQVIRVYTNEVHPESGGFSFGSGQPIWNNAGDIAELYDADKQLISRYTYGNKR
jgi:hypothetical protein